MTKQEQHLQALLIDNCGDYFIKQDDGYDIIDGGTCETVCYCETIQELEATVKEAFKNTNWYEIDY